MASSSNRKEEVSASSAKDASASAAEKGGAGVAGPASATGSGGALAGEASTPNANAAGATSAHSSVDTAASKNFSAHAAGREQTDALTPMQMSAVLSYFKQRGFKKGEDALKAEMDALANGATSAQARAAIDARMGSPSVSLQDLAVKTAPREPTGSGLSTSNGASATNLSPVEQAAVDALMLDPTDRSRGFAKLRNWCEGSLDIYQPELQPLLLPLFIHSYLDLIDLGYTTAAGAFYQANSQIFLPHHAALLADIRAVSLPSHISADPLAQRFRSERYVIKMSVIVFSLLLGWLTDGGGPAGGAGAGEGVGDDGKGDMDKRSREAMLKIINERLRIQVIEAKSQQLSLTFLEEGAGLTGVGPTFSGSGARSRKYPALQATVVSERDVVLDYNAAAAGPQLKLGASIPLSEKLQVEVEREVRDIERHEGGEGAGAEGQANEIQVGATAPNQKGLLQPAYADLPPQPPVYRMMDIEREVARVRDARKALRFNLSLNATTGDALSNNLTGPSFMSGVRDASFNALGEEGSKAARIAASPSVCAYTYHDAVDGLTCSRFSKDLTLMAAGFEESYVQIWSLKGEPLRGMRNDFSLSQIRDRKTLDQHRENTVRSTRKLIGHSGPVYDVSFDPVRGTAAPPRHLLSASGDSTVRLWSLDTFSALVAYRGHQQPVWSVQWSPLGIYFATAGADRTARLWCTERVNPLRIYAGHLSDVDCLDFHPNSLYLATGSSDKSSRLWDVQRGACVRLFVGHQSPVSCVKISPDGRYLASAGAGNAPSTTVTGDDCSISLWDLGSGRRIKKMWGHSAPVLSLDFSADGCMLVSSGADCQVRCWDVRGPGGARKASGFENKGPSGVSTNDGGMTGATTTAGVGAHDAAALAATVNGVSAEGSMPMSAASAHHPKTPLSGVSASVNGNGANVHLDQSSADCIQTFYTKQTPMLDVHFTPRNLCLAAGAFDASL